MPVPVQRLRSTLHLLGMRIVYYLYSLATWISFGKPNRLRVSQLKQISQLYYRYIF